MIRKLTLAFSLVVCSLLAFSAAQAQVTIDVSVDIERRRSGLRPAANSCAGLSMGARLLGVGRRQWLLLGARHMGIAAGA